MTNDDNLIKIDEIAEGHQVIVMCGVSGSGKTFLARRLVGKGFLRLSSDEIIWSRYGDRFPGIDPETRKAAFIWAADEIDSSLASLIRKGEKVVVDSTMCKTVRRSAIRAVCAECGVKPLFVYLKTPLATLVERLDRRKGDGPDDQIVSRQEVYAFHAGFQPPGEEETDVITLES